MAMHQSQFSEVHFAHWTQDSGEWCRGGKVNSIHTVRYTGTNIWATEKICVIVGLRTYFDVFRSVRLYSLYVYLRSTYLYNVIYLLLQGDVRYWYRFATSRHRPVSPAKCIWNDATIKHICCYWQMQTKDYRGECYLTLLRMLYAV